MSQSSSLHLSASLWSWSWLVGLTTKAKKPRDKTDKKTDRVSAGRHRQRRSPEGQRSSHINELMSAGCGPGCFDLVRRGRGGQCTCVAAVVLLFVSRLLCWFASVCLRFFVFSGSLLWVVVGSVLSVLPSVAQSCSLVPETETETERV